MPLLTGLNSVAGAPKLTDTRYAAMVHQDRVLKSGHCDDKTKALSSFYLRLTFKECVDSQDQARLEFLQKNGKEAKLKEQRQTFKRPSAFQTVTVWKASPKEGLKGNTTKWYQDF